MIERSLGGDEFRNFKFFFSVFDPAGVDVVAVRYFIGQNNSIVVVRNYVAVSEIIISTKGKFSRNEKYEDNEFNVRIVSVGVFENL